MVVLMQVLCRLMVTSANFHVVNIYYGLYGDSGFDYQMVIPSTQWGCQGFQNATIAGGKYPDCYGGYSLHIPDNTCGFSGVMIRPACSGRYFGKVLDKDGVDIGDCYWNDAGNISAFACKLNVSDSNFQIVYDRLLCSTKMCGS